MTLRDLRTLGPPALVKGRTSGPRVSRDRGGRVQDLPPCPVSVPWGPRGPVARFYRSGRVARGESAPRPDSCGYAVGYRGSDDEWGSDVGDGGARRAEPGRVSFTAERPTRPPSPWRGGGWRVAATPSASRSWLERATCRAQLQFPIPL